MSKIPAAEMRLHLQELASLLASDLSDNQIMTQLGLKRRTYFYRKSCVHKIFGNIAEKKTEETLEAEAQLLKDRFLRLYRQLEQNIANSNDRLRDKAQAAHVAAEIAIRCLQLEIEGIRERRELKQAEAAAEGLV